MSEQYNLYSDEELRLQRIGARLLILKLLQTARPDWNGSGIRLWAGYQLQELERQEDGRPDDSQLHIELDA